MYYVYILKSIFSPKKIYIGFSSNLQSRFAQHNRGESDYTSRFLPWKLIYYESYFPSKDAQNRERQLKRFAKAWDN